MIEYDTKISIRKPRGGYYLEKYFEQDFYYDAKPTGSWKLEITSRHINMYVEVKYIEKYIKQYHTKVDKFFGKNSYKVPVYKTEYIHENYISIRRIEKPRIIEFNCKENK